MDRKLRWVALVCGAWCAVGTALGQGTVNYVAAGVAATQMPAGMLQLDVSYAVEMSDVHQNTYANSVIEWYRGGNLLGIYEFAAIDLGAISDGTNCVSGGASCSGNCKVKDANGNTLTGSCIRDGLQAGVICICSTNGSKSVLVPGTPAPGDQFRFRMDPNNSVAEVNETDNVATLSF
jgi:hypothetical protein